ENRSRISAQPAIEPSPNPVVAAPSTLRWVHDPKDTVRRAPALSAAAAPSTLRWVHDPKDTVRRAPALSAAAPPSTLRWVHDPKDTVRRAPALSAAAAPSTLRWVHDPKDTVRRAPALSAAAAPSTLRWVHDPKDTVRRAPALSAAAPPSTLRWVHDPKDTVRQAPPRRVFGSETAEPRPADAPRNATTSLNRGSAARSGAPSSTHRERVLSVSARYQQAHRASTAHLRGSGNRIPPVLTAPRTAAASTRWAKTIV